MSCDAIKRCPLCITEMCEYPNRQGYSSTVRYNPKFNSHTFTITDNGVERFSNDLPDLIPPHTDKGRYMKEFCDDLIRGFLEFNYREDRLNPQHTNCKASVSHLRPTIEKVIFNAPATIVFWSDGTKTVVKTQNGEEFDPEKGLAMAMAKRAFGNEGNYYNHIKKWVDKYHEDCCKPEVFKKLIEKHINKNKKE